MPTIHTINKIKIQIFANDHNPPHFHVYDAGIEAKIDIITLQFMVGQIRRNTFSLVIDWAADHRDFLMSEWERMQK